MSFYSVPIKYPAESIMIILERQNWVLIDFEMIDQGISI